MRKKCCVLLLIGMLAFGLCACGKTEFSEKGQIAVDNVKELQSYMKAPDTFILRDDVLVIDENDKTFVYIIYSAENSFGVPLQDMDVFCDGEYCGSFYDMKESQQISRADYETEEAYIEALEKRRIELLCLMTFTNWQLGKIEDYEVVICESIAKKLGIEYKTGNN